MPERSYLDYERIDSDNQNGSPPLRFPEGWPGSAVNGAMAALASAVRNLGDNAAKLPVNSDGSVNSGPNNGRVGLLAFANPNDLELTGGETYRQSRKVPGKDIRFFWGTAAEAQAEEQYGWAICDGRTVNGITTPDLRGHFPFFYDPVEGIAAKSYGGDVFVETEESGWHSHSGTVFGHQLTPSEVPALNVGTIAVESGNNRTVVNAVSYNGNGVAHTHDLGIDSDGTHTHQVNLPLPPYAAFIPLMYVGV